MLAWETGLRVLESLKITSVMASPRRFLAELSLSTQRTASVMLDLPQPLGPTTAVILLGKLTVVGSTKDLKPAKRMHFSRTNGSLKFAVYYFFFAAARGLRLVFVSAAAAATTNSASRL